MKVMAINYFSITTDAETGKKIEKFFQSSVNRHRSIELKSIRYEEGLASKYCVVCIQGKNGEEIRPSDIFFLGLFCHNY